MADEPSVMEEALAEAQKLQNQKKWKKIPLLKTKRIKLQGPV